MEFDDLIAPLSRQGFLSDYWGKSFAHLPGQAGRFAPLLTWDELNDILERDRLAPPRLKLSQNGNSVDPGRYIVAGMDGAPRVDSGKLIACLSQGATLVIDCIEELAPRVSQVCLALQQALRVGNYANLYAGWHRQNGFDLHWDAQDSIILQVSGRKRWQVYRPTRLHPLQDDLEAPVRPSGPPFWEGTVEDGDLLHIPRGWWHVAYPVGAPSLHLTVTNIPPSGINVMGWLAGKLRHYPQMRMNVPHSAGETACRDYVARLRAHLSAAIDDDMLEMFWREWEADIRPKPRIRLPLAPYEQNSVPDDTMQVRLASSNRLWLEAEPDGRSVRFRAGGTVWVCPTELVAALELLSNGQSVAFAALGAALRDEMSVANLKICLGALARAGVVLLEKTTPAS